LFLFQVERETANDKHAFSKFSTGSRNKTVAYSAKDLIAKTGKYDLGERYLIGQTCLSIPSGDLHFIFLATVPLYRQTMIVDPTPVSPDTPKRNLRYELHTFWKQNYSANLMTVCLIHNESLDRLEEMAKEHFLPIRNKNIPEMIWDIENHKPFR
jgi:hypothetical protein